LFYNFYFLLTGVHATHMIIGISLLDLLLVQTWWWHKPFNVRRMLTAVGLFWAFIDVVWLFIYSSLYLINRGGAA
jgi:cytochrome c oxidase subunit 3